MLKNFKKSFNGSCGVKLTPQSYILCKLEWPAFEVGWPPEKSLDKSVIDEVLLIVVRTPGHPDQFPNIDCLQKIVQKQPPWLRAYLEEQSKLMSAQTTVTTKTQLKGTEQKKILTQKRQKGNHSSP